ncbi:hypothetical protein GCM10023169_13390 [Georgenia halophila]|uniref:Uncharacterized protein n=1 Tax=Georgenia halophila TaxID=620889 RepID=A0ABP8L3H9_9MICO
MRSNGDGPSGALSADVAEAWVEESAGGPRDLGVTGVPPAASCWVSSGPARAPSGVTSTVSVPVAGVPPFPLVPGVAVEPLGGDDSASLRVTSTPSASTKVTSPSSIVIASSRTATPSATTRAAGDGSAGLSAPSGAGMEMCASTTTAALSSTSLDVPVPVLAPESEPSSSEAAALVPPVTTRRALTPSSASDADVVCAAVVTVAVSSPDAGS